jgi:hypothetical protein
VHASVGALDHGLPVWGQTTELAEDIASLLPLLWTKAFEGFHSLQDAILLLGRQAIEMLQALAQLLLPVGGQAAEGGISFECPLLFCQRHILVPAQPVARTRARVAAGFAPAPFALRPVVRVALNVAHPLGGCRDGRQNGPQQQPGNGPARVHLSS